MPQAIAAATAITRAAESQPIEYRSRSDMARGYTLAGAVQVRKGCGRLSVRMVGGLRSRCNPTAVSHDRHDK
jgi:hypothetical protein